MDFFDHLWEQMQNGKVQRQTQQTLEHLRRLALECPPVRHFFEESTYAPCELIAWTGLAASTQTKTFCYFDGTDPQFEPFSLRAERQAGMFAGALRIDPIYDEFSILQSRIMGADAFVVSLSQLDSARVQYAMEVAVELKFPVLLQCCREEELAQAILLHKAEHVMLSGTLAARQLLDFQLLEASGIWLDLRGSDVTTSEFNDINRRKLAFIY